MYVFVETIPTYVIVPSNSDNYVKIGNTDKLVDGSSGDDGTPPDFKYISTARLGGIVPDRSGHLGPNVHAEVVPRAERHVGGRGPTPPDRHRLLRAPRPQVRPAAHGDPDGQPDGHASPDGDATSDPTPSPTACPDPYGHRHPTATATPTRPPRPRATATATATSDREPTATPSRPPHPRPRPPDRHTRTDPEPTPTADRYGRPTATPHRPARAAPTARTTGPTPDRRPGAASPTRDGGGSRRQDRDNGTGDPSDDSLLPGSTFALYPTTATVSSSPTVTTPRDWTRSPATRLPRLDPARPRPLLGGRSRRAPWLRHEAAAASSTTWSPTPSRTASSSTKPGALRAG